MADQIYPPWEMGDVRNLTIQHYGYIIEGAEHPEPTGAWSRPPVRTVITSLVIEWDDAETGSHRRYVVQETAGGLAVEIGGMGAS